MRYSVFYKSVTPCVLVTLLLACLSGCVVLPKKDVTEKLECGLSSNKKVLRVVNLTDGDTSFYQWSDELVAFITIPASAIVSGTYVLVNNIYHTAQKTIKCGNKAALPEKQTEASAQQNIENKN